MQYRVEGDEAVGARRPAGPSVWMVRYGPWMDEGPEVEDAFSTESAAIQYKDHLAASRGWDEDMIDIAEYELDTPTRFTGPDPYRSILYDQSGNTRTTT